MAQHNVLILNQTVPQIQEPQVGDTYLLPRDVEIQGNLTISGNVDGIDVAAAGALAASATQPGDNLSTLVNDMLASQGEAEAGVDNTKLMTPLRVAQAIAILAAGLKNNFAAVTDPANTDDDTEGYSIGSVWINTLTNEAYRCVDATTNLAVWVNTTVTAADLATVALSGDSDDLTEGSVKLLMTAAERAKLTGIDANAKDDQTGAEIKALYEAEANTNAFTDAAKLATDNGWRDLRCSLVASATGTGTPTLTAFGPTGTIKQLAFGVGDSVYVAAHIDHDIKPGSTIYPHVHWTTNGTNANSVKWELTYIAAAGHNQANFGPNVVVNVEEAAHGSAWRHMITEDATGFAAPEVDSVIIMEVKRITNGATDNADVVFGLFIDFHYESDRSATPNRSPNFYA